MEPEITVVTTEAEVRACWPVFRALRPHLAGPDDLVRRWRRQAEESYRLAVVRDGGGIAGVAGYRLLHTMAWGRICYLDDLVVDPARRGAGLGAALLRFVQAEAVRLACDAVHLDTGYQRHAAHRTYLRNGFELSCHHLEWRVPGRS